jgi:hypothetical protein
MQTIRCHTFHIPLSNHQNTHTPIRYRSLTIHNLWSRSSYSPLSYMRSFSHCTTTFSGHNSMVWYPTTNRTRDSRWAGLYWPIECLIDVLSIFDSFRQVAKGPPLRARSIEHHLFRCYTFHIPLSKNLNTHTPIRYRSLTICNLWRRSAYSPLSYVGKPVKFRKSSAHFRMPLLHDQRSCLKSELCIVLDRVMLTYIEFIRGDLEHFWISWFWAKKTRRIFNSLFFARYYIIFVIYTLQNAD